MLFDGFADYFMPSHPLFKDRADAGQQLGERLKSYRGRHPLVLALPRGGVAVAFEVAKKLDAQLDVLVARKLGVPQNPELGMGAIAEGGVMILNEREMGLFGITKRALQDVIVREAAEMERRIALFRGNRHNPQVSGRTVILVDDGLATGVTARAAVASVRQEDPGELIFAVPVCAQETADLMRPLVGRLVCLKELEDLYAVGMWYEYFPQLTDRQVVDILESAHRSIVPRNPSRSDFGQAGQNRS